MHPDFVFFTGDLAFGNVPESSIEKQFSEGTNFLETIRTSFDPEIPISNIFVVPGNHDVDRKEVATSETVWLDGLLQQAGENATQTVDDMIRTKGAQWQRFALRLARYRAWLESAGYHHLLQDPDRLVFGDIRRAGGSDVGIAGLNSAWSCSRDGEKGKLWLGRWQLGELVRKLKNTPIKLALSHHPCNWFNEHEDSVLAREIERNFNFLLHGHEHSQWISMKNNHVTIAAGACYECSNKENGYNIVRLFPKNGTGEVFLRRFDASGGGWVPRIVYGKTDEAGRWLLSDLPFPKLSYRRQASQGTKRTDVFRISTLFPHFVRVAVLPFRLSKVHTVDDFLVDGFCDDIVSRLSKISELRVFSFESTLRFREAEESATAFARELGAEAVLTGSFIEYEGRIRLHLFLLATDTGITLWAGTYTFATEKLFDAQQKVAVHVAKGLKVRLSKVDYSWLNTHYTGNADAYEFYLKGKGLLFTNSEQDLRSAIAMFAQAIQLDGEFVDAIAGKAYALWKRYFFGWDATEDTLFQALSLAEQAIQISPSSAMARMAIVRICWDLGGHERAVVEGRAAIRENPNSIDALICMGRAYNNSGMAEKTIPVINMVIEIEPMNPPALKLLIFSSVMTKQYELADQTVRRYRKRNLLDSNSCWAAAIGYLHSGNLKKAIEVSLSGLQADPANFTLWPEFAVCGHTRDLISR